MYVSKPSVKLFQKADAMARTSREIQIQSQEENKDIRINYLGVIYR